MANYMTAQRKKLIDFLRSHPDKQFSAREIAEQLDGESISVSAVYRNLSSLENSGFVSRSVQKGSRDSYYRYTASEHCKDCIHLTCTKCSKIFHLSSTLADRMENDLFKSEGFTVSRPGTVIYGVCKTCKEQ